jgi:cytochrome P450
VPWLFWVNDYLTPWIGNQLAANNRHGPIRDMAAKEVEGRKERGSNRKDLLSKLLSVHIEKPEQFDYAALVSMATSNIGAGSDTTAISIRAAIYFLLRNPAAKQSLLDELQFARSQGKLSDPILLAEANDMPYLQACLYEALRLHPAVGMSLPRVVPEGGTTVNGIYIPAKTIIGANPWVIHRMKSIFGEDVEHFRPERWLGADAGDMRRFFFAFGAGARSCIGKNISWMEMSKLIPTLFMHFDMELDDPNEELVETCWWFVIQKGLHVRLRQKVVSDPGY